MSFIARTHSQQGPNEQVDDRETTPEVFAELHDRFWFTLDAAASPHNAKLPRFFSIEENGLEMPWSGEQVWCNPPYSNIRPWVSKAWDEWSKRKRPTGVVMLLPANRTEQGWWQDLVEPHLRLRRSDFAVEFLRGRMRFIAANDTHIRPNQRPPFGVCLLIWGGR
jgi:phage N-6-adenine-methyltransferase